MTTKQTQSTGERIPARVKYGSTTGNPDYRKGLRRRNAILKAQHELAQDYDKHLQQKIESDRKGA